MLQACGSPHSEDLISKVYMGSKRFRTWFLNLSHGADFMAKGHDAQA